MRTIRASKSLSAMLIAALAAALYSINLGRLPHPDELYHMLAAQGVVLFGEPLIGEHGYYWRGYPFTWLVARSIDAFGATLAVGRLPAVVAAVTLVILVFLCLHRHGGALVAWLGAILFATSPFVIDIAQFVRFYSLQCLAFFAGAWIVYELASADWRWGQHLPAALVAVALLGLAAYLQPTTLLGLAGLALWLIGVAFVRLRRSILTPRQLRLLVGAAILLAAAGLAVALASGLLASLWAMFRATPLFGEDRANEFWYYFLAYFLLYPTLWTTIGILTLFSWRKDALFTSFLLSIFVVGFILNSLAGPKNLRYIAYAQPFLYALWAMGLGSMIDLGREMLRRLHHELQGSLLVLPSHWRPRAASGFFCLAVLSLVLANPAWLRSATLLAEVTLPTQTPPTDWQAAADVLRPRLETVDIVVTTEELGPLFYYGRADLMLSATKYAEIPADRRHPFAPDHRTDVPTITSADELRLTMDCRESGLFLTQAKHWGTGALRLRDPAVEALIGSRASEIAVPARSQLRAFEWYHAGADPDDPACAVVPRSAGPAQPRRDSPGRGCRATPVARQARQRSARPGCVRSVWRRCLPMRSSGC